MQLPPVNIDAPAERRAKQAVSPSQRAVRAARRAAAQRSAARPAAATPVLSTAAAPERGDGPVNGFVATRTVTGSKTDTPIAEIPQSISVVTRDQITAQGAQSVKDSLRYTAGVFSDTLGAADFSSTFMRIRGFRTDLYLDGLRLPQPPSSSAYPEVEAYNLERVEVLKGPSSGLYGSSGPGGIVALTSKRPTDVPFREVQFQTGSYNRKQVAFDFSDRFAGSENAAFRVVGLVRDADHQIDYFQDKREFIAPSLTLKNDQTKLTLLSSYFHSDQRFAFFNYLPASGTILPNPNGRISQNLFTGEPAFDRLKREQFTAGYAFEHVFNEALAFRQNLQYVNINLDMPTTAIGRAGSNLAANNDPRTGLVIGDPTFSNIRRGAIFNGSDNQSISIDNQLQAKFATGPFAHNAVFGLDYRNFDSTYQFLGSTTPTTLNVFNPVYGTVIAPPTVPFSDDVYKLKQLGLYAQDQIKLDNWILTVGGRQDWATTLRNNKLNTMGFTGPSDSAFTGRVGLGYEFHDGVVPYVSYATSFDPVLGTTITDAPLRPTTGEQYEAGVKYQPRGTKTLVTAAVFDLTQQNVPRADPINTARQIQTGEINVKGFEFEARIELLERLNIIAGYTFLDGVITKSVIPGEVGNRPQYTPRNQVALWAQYAFDGPYAAGLTVGAGMRYVGGTSAFQPTTNYGGTIGTVPAYVLETPAYTLFDAMMSYDLKYLSPSFAGATLRINATNIFNQYYISGCGTTYQCTMGTARTVLATLTHRW